MVVFMEEIVHVIPLGYEIDRVLYFLRRDMLKQLFYLRVLNQNVGGPGRI